MDKALLTVLPGRLAGTGLLAQQVHDYPFSYGFRCAVLQHGSEQVHIGFRLW
jgi:hypothetical protein